MEDENNKCTSCTKGIQKYKEYLPNLTITYFSCGHQDIGAVVNESIGITELIKTKLNQDISKDYEELAYFHHTMSQIKTAKKSDDDEGKMFFEGYKEKLSNAICVKAKACEKIKTLDNGDLSSLVSFVSDIITSFLVGFPLPIWIVSRIIVKRGICNFCNCDMI